MVISSIVAHDKNLVIGKGNSIPWYLPADLRHFKQTTTGRTVLSGRKNFDDLGKPLPRRTNIVITRNTDFEMEGVQVFHTIADGIEYAKQSGEKELFIIGGGQIYDQTKHLWQRLYVTEIDMEVEGGEIYFPKIDFSTWNLLREEPHLSDEKNEFDFLVKVYERKVH